MSAPAARQHVALLPRGTVCSTVLPIALAFLAPSWSPGNSTRMPIAVELCLDELTHPYCVPNLCRSASHTKVASSTSRLAWQACSR